MKHENLHIICENLEQRQRCFDVLEGMGLSAYGVHRNYLCVNAIVGKGKVESDKYMTVIDGDIRGNSEVLSGSEFIDKYGKQNMQKLKDKIAEVEKHLNVSQRTLSNRMGRSSNYLSSMVLSGCSTDKQGEIIAILDQIKDGAAFQKPEDKIAALEIRLAVSENLAQKSTLNNIALHKLLRQQEKDTLYWISRNPHTTMQAFKLFIEILFGRN